MKALLQSALEVALSVVRANPTVLEGLGAQLEGTSWIITQSVSLNLDDYCYTCGHLLNLFCMFSSGQ